MQDKFTKYKGAHGWILRAGYLVALILFAVMCFQFFTAQKSLNQRTDQIREISDSFAALDVALLKFGDKAASIAEVYEPNKTDSGFTGLARGMSLKAKKEFLSRLPVDPDILSSKQALEYWRNDAQKQFDRLLVAWRKSGEEISTFLFKGARFMKLDDPFKHYISLLDDKNISEAKSKKDIYWVSRQIHENYESLIKPSDMYVENKLRILLNERAVTAGKLLERYMLFGLGIVGLVALFIFIPVDIFLQKLMNKLELEHQRAEEAMTRARNSDRAKSEFLANMSHEIRTPMNGVMGMAELLAKTDLNARQRTFTDIIVKSGASLLTIINDILDFSKIDAGQMELDPAPFRLAEAIEDVTTLISSKVAEKDLELIVRVDPKMPQCLIGDVGRMRQIITNIIGNAVKFTDKGHVYVNAYVVDDGQRNENREASKEDLIDICIEIEDTGVGIAKEKAAEIFEKFSQVDGSATRKHEGTGLGLSIASSLVKLMGGTISLSSEPGKGSIFKIELSLPIDVNIARKPRVPVDVSGARVLIVDDNEVNRSILSEQMESWRFDAACAASGKEALALLEEAQKHDLSVDCVILDYHMPELNGGDVVKAMRSMKQLVDVPVIMLTSVDQTEDGKTFSSLGIEAHLTKPARSSLLLETIIDVLHEAKARVTSDDEASKGIMMAQQIASGNRTQVIDDKPKPQIENDLEIEVPAINERSVKADRDFSKTAHGNDSGIDILVCEDNEVNQIVFSQILQSTGYKFEIVDDGKKGVAAYHAQAPRLILMDVSMPNMNGFEATKAIREHEEKSGEHTPIIGVTAHAIKGDREKCLEAGMDDYLAKPISPDRLQEKVDLLLEDSKRALASN